MCTGTMVSMDTRCCEDNADDMAVGGEILDLALGQAKLRARILKCGSQYTSMSKE